MEDLAALSTHELDQWLAVAPGGECGTLATSSLLTVTTWETRANYRLPSGGPAGVGGQEEADLGGTSTKDDLPPALPPSGDGGKL